MSGKGRGGREEGMGKEEKEEEEEEEEEEDYTGLHRKNRHHQETCWFLARVSNELRVREKEKCE